MPCSRSILPCGTLGMMLIILGLRVVPGVPAEAGEKKTPPNIVFILADDLGYGALGCYGQQKIQTPHLDRLAAQGMRFTQAYAGSHVCQPSRSVLMTGMHTGHAAVRANDVDQMLLDEDVTVAEVLKRSGYTNGCYGKWGLGFEDTSGHVLRQGFDDFFGHLLQVHAHFYYPYWVWKNDAKHFLPGNDGGQRGQYVHDEIHQQAKAFIRANQDGPFFAYLPYIIPHVELTVPEDSEEPYRGKFPRRAILDTRPGYIGSDDGYTTLAGMISRLDRGVGEILQLLEDLGIADNTVVIFSSDNGGQNGGRDGGWTAMTDFFEANGPLRGYKGAFYEGGIRVPFIVRWPGHVQPGTTSDVICGFQDVLPTLAELAGQPAPEKIDGISLVPALTGKGQLQQRDAMYWEHPVRGGISQAVRMGRWKAIRSGPDQPIVLFDLQTDIGETKNVAAQHPDVIEKVEDVMQRSHAEPRQYARQTVQPTIQDYVR